jgi:hypothetical protein
MLVFGTYIEGDFTAAELAVDKIFNALSKLLLIDNNNHGLCMMQKNLST